MWPRARRALRALRPVEIAAAVALTAIADVTLWGNDFIAPGGFGLALLFVLLPIVAFAATRVWRGSVRLAVVAGLLVLVAARCAFDPGPASVLCGIGLLFAFPLALRTRQRFVPEVAIGALVTPVKVPSLLRSLGAGVKRLAARTRLGRVSVLPIVIPAALVAVFLGVFALANPVVARALSAAWTAIASVVALPSIGRVILWTVALIRGLTMLRPAFARPARVEVAPAMGEASPVLLSVARNALVGLNVVFLAYNVLDATYLWSGSPPAGMQTRQYAHEGAFWLTLALLMLTAVVGVMFRGPLAHDTSRRAKTSRWLAYAWMGQGLVLALGTYRRIAIHIGHSGLSDLRIVGILGTTLVVGGVVLVALKLRKGRTFVWLLRRQLDAFALTAVIYAVAPTHWISAHVNVARVQGGEYRPILHAFRQSHEAESAAALLPLLHHSDPRIRQGVAVLLDEERDRLRHEEDNRGTWRERDLVTTRALAALDGASGEIATSIGSADRHDARRVLLEISHVANENRSLEEILAIPSARNVSSY